MGKPRLQLEGLRFGKLIVLRRVLPEVGRSRFVCVCDCGVFYVGLGTDIKSGNTTSCGCFKREIGRTSNLKHGASREDSRTGAYRSWATMKSRCYNEDNNRFDIYGGRGIKVCDRWLSSFENFLADMGERPDGHSLDRIDVNGDYTPENCRWASSHEQARNQRTNVWYLFEGERMIQADVARKLGVYSAEVTVMRRNNRLPSNIQALTA
jgi:hypothetical protein